MYDDVDLVVPPDEGTRVLVERYADAHPDTFGGCWVAGPDREQVFVLAFTGDLEVHRRGLPEDVRVVQARYFWQELSRAASESQTAARAAGFESARARVRPVENEVELYFVAEARDDLEAVSAIARDVHPAITVKARRPMVRHARRVTDWSPTERPLELAVSWEGIFDEPATFEVSETPEEIRILIVEERRADITGSRSIAKHHVVALAGPLANRRVVDASVDDDPPSNYYS